MTKVSPTDGKIQQAARLRWVPIDKMKINPLAQRELNQSRVDKLAADFDLDQIGVPVVSHREGTFHIIDGQHRIRALEAMGWGDQQIQCWCYEGLDSSEEAEIFLKRNDVLAIDAMSKYKTSVEAGREVEVDIDRIVHANGLVVSKDGIPGAIHAVGTLRRVYTRSGGPTLGRTLRIIRDAYGDAGLEALVIDGVGLLCQRYNGDLDEAVAVTRLGGAHGGSSGLLGHAEKLRRQTGNAKAHCVAAAAVEFINRGKGGKKLDSWWKATA